MWNPRQLVPIRFSNMMWGSKLVLLRIYELNVTFKMCSEALFLTLISISYVKCMFTLCTATLQCDGARWVLSLGFNGYPSFSACRSLWLYHSYMCLHPCLYFRWVPPIFSKLCSWQVLFLSHLKSKSKICYSIAYHCWDSSTSLKDSSSIRHSQLLCIATNQIWFALKTWTIHKLIVTTLPNWLRWS